MLPIKGSVKKKSVPFVFPPSALLAQGIIHPWGAQYSRGQPGSRTVLGNNRTCQHLGLGPVNPTTTRTRISVLHTRSCLCITPCGVGFAMWSLLRGLPGTTYPSWPRTREISCLTLLNAGMTSILYFIFVQQMGSNHTLTFYRIPSE